MTRTGRSTLAALAPYLALPALLIAFEGGSVGALAALQDPAAEESAAETEIVARRIWAPSTGKAPLGSVSLDGRYMSYSDYSRGGGDVGVLDLKTREERILTEGREGFADAYSIISPDGRWIAYAWFNGTHFDLRIISREDGEERVIYSNREASWTMPGSWSPDGSTIATLIVRTDGARQIGLVSPEDGSFRVLKSMTGWRTPWDMTFSPDARYIGYTLAAASDESQTDIYVLAVDGSSESAAVQNPAHDRLYGWTPDGGALLFTSDRSGTPGLWAVQVADGRARGQPTLLKPDLWRAGGGLGVSGDGDLFYTVESTRRDVYTATLAPRQDALVTEPTAVGGSYPIANASPAWSSDGRHLAFVVRSPGTPSGLGSRRIVVRSLATGESMEIVPRLQGYLGQLQWAPDDDAFFVAGGDERGRWGYFRVDRRTGALTNVLPGNRGGRDVTWTRDRKTIFYHTRYGPVGVLARDATTGEQRELYVQHPGVDPMVQVVGDGPEDEFMFRSMALSPDERQLALVSYGGDALRLMPVTGGPPSDLVRARDGDFGNIVAWTPDGEHLLVTRASGDGESGAAGATMELLWKVPLDGSEGEPVGLELSATRLQLHPDGRRLAFIDGERKIEVWTMENVASIPGSDAAVVSEGRR